MYQSIMSKEAIRVFNINNVLLLAYKVTRSVVAQQFKQQQQLYGNYLIEGYTNVTCKLKCECKQSQTKHKKHFQQKNFNFSANL